ncbi:MAG: sugar phosphate isomerase/epimerase family protein [Bacillota bacterium]
MKIGLQLFTVRKQAQKDLYNTLSDISQMGIRYIEAARIDFDQTNAEIFLKANADFGIEVVSTQIKFKKLKEDFDKVLQFHKKTNCKNAVISVLPTKSIVGSKEELLNFCKEANELGKKYRAEKIELCFHHHDFEFLQRDYGMQIDILEKNLETAFIIDTYWAAKGGIPADKLTDKLKKVKGYHLRDYGLCGVMRKAKDFALGDGVIDFKSIIEKGENQNVEYAVIEQNTKTPFDELKKSVEHIKTLGFGDLLK